MSWCAGGKTGGWRPRSSEDRSRRRLSPPSPTPRSKTWRRIVSERLFRIWRGTAAGGSFVEYRVDVDPGMVVLDVLHRIQARLANDLAIRWNCKAGKCGSCSMEINGRPRLACMTRMNQFGGARLMIRLASLEMHPLDTEDRVPALREEFGSGLCNITRCCTEVCPEQIQITDNGIIPLKERVVDRYFDPLLGLVRKVFRRK